MAVVAHRHPFYLFVLLKGRKKMRHFVYTFRLISKPKMTITFNIFGKRDSYHADLTFFYRLGWGQYPVSDVDIISVTEIDIVPINYMQTIVEFAPEEEEAI